MKIEVNRIYRDGRGNIVLITQYNPSSTLKYCFTGNYIEFVPDQKDREFMKTLAAWGPTGQYQTFPCDYDLVSEVITPIERLERFLNEV